MIFMDLDKIYREQNIPNKYTLTLVVAARARQLSERMGPLPGYDEKFITKAVEDVANGCVEYKFVDKVRKQVNEPLEEE